MYIQPIFRSHPNFGLFTLDDDNEELTSLYNQFANTEIIFIGSSTGCQNILFSNAIKNRLCILIGPVSDREYEENKNKNILDIYKKKIENMHDIFCYNGNLYQKERWKDFYLAGGRDDLFSSDLDDKHFQNLNKGNNLHFVICENDEFCVISNKEKLKLVPKSILHVLKGANHFCTNPENLEDLETLLDSIILPDIK